jgi:hypothetical protein
MDNIASRLSSLKKKNVTFLRPSCCPCVCVCVCGPFSTFESVHRFSRSLVRTAFYLNTVLSNFPTICNNNMMDAQTLRVEAILVPLRATLGT